MQSEWEGSKLFEVDAPPTGEGTPEEKFFGNFPYPYMNGLLHLGHAFSLSKLEFASAYHRLLGKNVLFPQGFHCTGMPIKACADKLNRELDTYGCPPMFPSEEEGPEEASSQAPSEGSGNVKADPTKFSGKKSKAASKKGAGATQWQILKFSGIPEEEIPSFRRSDHWLRYFPPLAMRDLRAMGCGVDWRRSFVTTDINPYYDSFVRWQFWTLYNKGKVVKDKRYTVYSPLDGQPCADHDRASGEGVLPQEYTLIKMEALELNGKLAALQGKGKVYLMAATLRPETMYGQTNYWVLPEGQYGAFQGLGDEIYIMTERAARNLSYQEKTPQWGAPQCLLEITGQDLIGTPVRSPNCPLERIYGLPLLTVLTTKGTGVVTSVPSDSPDDYMGLMDLKKKPKLREKYGVKDEWVLPFEVIPIIDIPGFGDTAAKKVCEDLKIQSQNDAKLAEAKQLVYLKGFTDGTMVVGKYAGRPVQEVKALLKEDLVSSGQALLYSEPEKVVMSRSGDECVVALTDQWYLVYGEEEWLKATRECLQRMETYGEEARNGFMHCLGWLQQWACSRSFGLGTLLPWDPQYLIESLSDSTIYMAYYTVAHVLQNGDIYGQSDSKVKPEEMTNEVWDYIFLGKDLPNTTIPSSVLQSMRREFEYWYPFDLRVSGKDLIQNHLTFALYNHTAIWREKYWPRGFRCNGHLLLNSEKMSKSTGNFKTLQEAIEDFSADAMRWALADAGDGMDDANFEFTTANAAILRLTKELTWIDEVLAASEGMRSGPASTHFDKVFENAINIAVASTRQAYDGMLFRQALKCAAYDLTNARDIYRFACGTEGLNRDLALQYIATQTQLMAPITPHTSEYIWMTKLGNKQSIFKSGWPQAAEPDFIMQRAFEYVEGLLPTIRKQIAKVEAPAKKKNQAAQPQARVTHIDIVVGERFIGWQEKVLNALLSRFDDKTRTFADDVFAVVLQSVQNDEIAQGKNDKQLKQLTLPFAKYKMEEAVAGGKQVLDVKLPFDEAQLLSDNSSYLLRSLKIDSLSVYKSTDLEVKALAEKDRVDISGAFPGTPVFNFKTQPVS